MGKWIKLKKDIKDRNWRKGQSKFVLNKLADDLIASGEAVDDTRNRKKLKVKDLKNKKEDDPNTPIHK